MAIPKPKPRPICSPYSRSKGKREKEIEKKEERKRIWNKNKKWALSLLHMPQCLYGNVYSGGTKLGTAAMRERLDDIWKTRRSLIGEEREDDVDVDALAKLSFWHLSVTLPCFCVCAVCAGYCGRASAESDATRNHQCQNSRPFISVWWTEISLSDGQELGYVYTVSRVDSIALTPAGMPEPYWHCYHFSFIRL